MSKIKMKWISSLLVITICLTMVLPAKANNLNDIKGHWAEESIERLIEKGITTGYPDGTYKPNSNISVIEFLAFVTRALELNIEVAKEGYWGQNYINKAISLKFIKDNEFDTYDRPINREEMASIVTKALEYKLGEALSVNEELKGQIDDFNQVSDKYMETVLKAYESGLITGLPDGRFNPDGKATRAEAAVVIIRLLDYGVEDIEEPEEGNSGKHVNETIQINDYWYDFAQENVGEGLFSSSLYFSTLEKDGKINYSDADHKGKTYEIDEANIPNLNNIINNLLSLFVQEDYYTHFQYYPDYDEVTIDYAKGLNGVMQNNSYIAYAFYLGEKHDLTEYSIEGEHDYSQLSKNVSVELELNYLFSSKYMPTAEDDIKGIYYHDFYADQLKESLIIVFGEEKADEVYKIVMDEYKLYAYDKQTYPNDATTYYVDNLRIDVTHYLKSRPLKFSFTFE